MTPDPRDGDPLRALVFRDLAKVPLDPLWFSQTLGSEIGRLGVSQRELASRAGVDHSTLSRFLSGNREPRLVTAVRYVRALAAFEAEEL